ncbi:MAG TPA: hypothetical protein VE974_12545 [Thermoanaerobaculia bacterium]|nr:hypothetical protein [Thermoanaerobaculia bacterium]
MSRKTMEREKRQLKIIFDGVIAMGPGHPEKGGQRGPFFGVLARSTRRLSDRSKRTGQKAQYTATHVPTIFTRMQPAKTSRPPDKIYQVSPYHPRWYMWHPLRERLEFRFDGDGKPGWLTYLRAGSKLIPDSGGGALQGTLTFHDIENASDMREIWPERCVLLDGLLSPDPGVDERVAAQVFVPRGHVTGAGVFKKGSSLDVVFDPARGRKSHPSLVPNIAVSTKASTLEIATYSLDSGDPLDSIQFDMTEDAELWVSNGDPTDVEIDVGKLSIVIAEHLRGKGVAAGDEERALMQRIGATFPMEGLDLAGVNRFMFEVCNGGYAVVLQDLVDDYPRAGNIDLDFELLYTLMKNEHLTRDKKGLPVPRRPRKDQKFYGPDCYGVICDTYDKAFLKSEYRKKSSSGSKSRR